MKLDSAHTNELNKLTKESFGQYDPNKLLDNANMENNDQSNSISYQEKYNSNKLLDSEKSEYTKRIEIASRSDGEWTGKIGESTLKLPNGIEIKYENGWPDFKSYSYGDVDISDMSSNKNKNWESAKRAYADKWNKEKKDGRSDWTPQDVQDYKTKNNLCFHECENMRTCQLIPEGIHKEAKHSGGRHECKIRNL